MSAFLTFALVLSLVNLLVVIWLARKCREFDRRADELRDKAPGESAVGFYGSRAEQRRRDYDSMTATVRRLVSELPAREDEEPL